MHELRQHTSNSQVSPLRLGASHGYRIEGDMAALNAELSFVDRAAVAAQQWALQLWACDEPYAGGALSGFKVAEAPIALPKESDDERSQLDALAFARPPASTRDYSMVLVLAGGQPGAFDQVHDFANYPARERFVAPHFNGVVGYKVLDGTVAIRCERVVNPRAASNLSGSLQLQLWALPEPYHGGSFAGSLLAAAALGQVHGQSSLEPAEQQLTLALPRPEEARVVLMLCEWTAAGYLTRDYCNFAEPYAGPHRAPASAAPVAATHEAEPALSAIEEGQPRPEAARAEAAVEPARMAGGAPVEAPAVDARPSLHTATAEELVGALGISKKLASDVIKARPFKSFGELTKVRGIGQKTIQKFRAALRA